MTGATTGTRPSFIRALVFNVAGLVTLLGLALLAIMTWQSTASTQQVAKQEIAETLDRAIERLQILIRAAEMTAESAERVATHPPVTGATLQATLDRSLSAFEQRPELSFLGIALAETGEYGNLERTDTGEIWLWLFPDQRGPAPVTRNFLLEADGFSPREVRREIDYDPRRRPFYQAVLGERSGHRWMPAYEWVVHRPTSEPLWGISYVKALRDDDGRLIGVLDTDLDLPALNRFLGSLETEYGVHLHIVELGASPSLIGGSTVGRVPLPVPEAFTPLLSPSGETFVNRVRWDHARHWTAARPVTLAGGLRWLVIASRDDPIIATPLRRQLYQVLGMGLAMVAALVLISMRMARRFGAPLEELERRVGVIAQTDGREPTPTSAAPAGFRETQLLDEALDRLAATVRQRGLVREQHLASLALKAAIFDSPTSAVFSIDDRQRLIDWNHTAERLFGVPADRALGQGLPDIVPTPEGEADWNTILERTGIHTWQFVGVDGVFDAELRRVAFRQDQREIRTLFLNDISERKNAERRLRQERDYLDVVLNSLPGTFYHLDEQGRFLRWNRHFEEVTGFSAAEIAAMRPPDFFPKEEKTRVTRAVNEAFARGSAQIEVDFVRRDGRHIQYLITGARFEYGGSAHLIGVGTNIEQRRRAEDALRESLARFDAAARATRDVVWDWDLAADTIWWSENFQILFGYPADEIESSIASWTRRLHPEDRDRVIAHIHEVIDGTDEIWTDEYRFLRKDGTYIDVFDRGHVLRDENGRGVRMVGAIQDISERKRAQTQLMLFNAELEERVADRTRELQALNKELESFSYSVSHDLRAPLRAIAGFAEILSTRYADTLDATARDYLARVLAATHRMGNLIDDLLNLSRVSRDEMRRETVDLSAIARDVLANLRESSPERQVTVHVEDGLTATGDARLLRIVLENLLGNAWKFTAKTPDARISFTAHSVHGTRMFEVADNGAGFDMRYADKLFGPFQRLHRTAEFPGTGIGLATVQRIIGRHGGEISAHGEPDHGATFRFSL